VALFRIQLTLRGDYNEVTAESPVRASLRAARDDYQMPFPRRTTTPALFTGGGLRSCAPSNGEAQLEIQVINLHVYVSSVRK
jgi:hypothetical protein